MNLLSSALAGLRDLGGVIGSFVIDATGAVVGMDLPAFFDRNAIAATGPRLGRLTETLSSRGYELHNVNLRFSGYQLWVQPSRGFTLCVLVPVECNVAALRMAASLVLKRIGSEVVRPESNGIPRFLEPSPSASGSRIVVSSDRVEDVAAQSNAELHRGAAPTSSRSSGAWGRSRVPGASASSSSNRRQFRGRPVDEEE